MQLLNFESTQSALMPVANKDRIRIDHLLDLVLSFHFEFSEGSETQL
jgi:hypothetical protein